MPKKTVRAVLREARLLELLDKVDLPRGSKLTVTLDLPDEAAPKINDLRLPVRDLGIKVPLTRDDLYDDRS